MKRKLLIIILSVMLLLSACDSSDDDRNDAQEDNSTEETSNIKEDDKKPKDESKNTEEKDMGKLAACIKTAEEMIDFLNEGLEKADNYDLTMIMFGYKQTDQHLDFIYSNYMDNGNGYEREDDNTEYEIYTVTKVNADNRVYNYLNINYDYEQRDIENIITDMSYFAEKNLMEYISTIREPESNTITKYYFDGEGGMCIVSAQLYNTTLFLDVLYYDGNFIGISQVYYENQTELRIPYDLAQMTPSSYEDLLTEDNYDISFSYDGQECQYDIEY